MKVKSHETDFKRKSKILFETQWCKYKIEYKIKYMWYIFENIIKKNNTYLLPPTLKNINIWFGMILTYNCKVRDKEINDSVNNVNEE